MHNTISRLLFLVSKLSYVQKPQDNLTLARQPSGSGSGGNGNVIYDDVIMRQQKYELRLILNQLQDY